MGNVKIDIGDFLGFCDLNGLEAVTSDQVEQLEEWVRKCQDAQNKGDELVSNAVYDRMMEILREKNPDSELVTQLWEDGGEEELDNYDSLFDRNPMYSIQTVKSLDAKEMRDFIARLPEGYFDAHISFKENGFGIRLVYSYGELVKARTRARSSQGKDITKQLRVVLGGMTHIEALESVSLCEIRGELLVSFENFERAKTYTPDIKSPFTAVSSMVKESASEDMWSLLSFVAYDVIADDLYFSTKTEMYDFIQDTLGFEIPVYWTVNDLNKESLIQELEEGIIPDCEAAAEEYEYYTDGLVFEVDDRQLFQSMGDNGTNYRYGNVALKVSYWEQNVYSGFVQTIVWTRGKTKLSPVAVIAEEPDIIEFTDYGYHAYVGDFKEIANMDELGVLTSGGNKVRRIPLYEPSNLLILDATVGNIIYFRYGGESGVTPCYPDGTPLVEGRVKSALEGEDDEYAFATYL